MNEKQMGLCILLLLLFLGALLWALWLRRKNHKLQELIAADAREAEEARRRKDLQEAMLPAQLLSLFQNGELEKIRLGEQKSIPAAVLSFNLPDFSEWIRTRTAEEIFVFVNGVLSHVVPSVLYQEGEIDRFVDAGLKAFFLKAPERALCAAISICEAMNQRGDEELAFSMGLTYGDVMVGMVGDERRFGALTISETTGLAQFLQEEAGRYGARILISGSMKKQIPGFEKSYNSRYLGRIWLKAVGVAEDLFDVYDGDEPETKNAKRKTRVLFENGVDLFQRRKFYDARLHFIEVLKANRMDGAAKRYLYLCNQYQESAEDDTANGCAIGQEEVYLEVY